MPGRAQSVFLHALFIAASALQFIPVVVCAQETRIRTAEEVLGQPVSSFLERVAGASAGAQDTLIRHAVDRISTSANALVTDSMVHFLYSGPAASVFVASDMNSWEPGADRMMRVAGSTLFHLAKKLPYASRVEYKFIVDSVWILDPVNPRKALGGYGYNSEVWMPGYRPPQEILEREGVHRGSLDTLVFASDTMGRSHPVIVYLPFGYGADTRNYESIWVTDGGEYLAIGLMNRVLDNMIHDGKIRPVIAVFVDPRTDPEDPQTNMRMVDYALNTRFLNALTAELMPRILKEYRVVPSEAVIMGASMGGLFSTFATVTRPDMFSGAAAQSPAYWWNDGAIFSLVQDRPPVTERFYIDTGTIRDAQAESSRMDSLLLALGCHSVYAEYPEGHNPVNWRSRIDDILLHFFGNEP